MKTIKFYLVIAVLALMSVSCVESSSKYKDLVAQRDSLAMTNQNLDSSYNQTIDLLNDIENGFSSISQKESEMKVSLNGVENTQSRKERIGIQMNEIKMTLEANKAKIEELQRLASKKGADNGKLSAMIKRLQGELEAKNVQIESLIAELKQKNITIDELNTTVSTQVKNIADQNTAIEQQKSTISSQDKNLHTAYYCVASSKELKAEGIITGGGLFKTKKISPNDLSNKYFTEIDYRTTTTIPTNSSKIKILSLHPQTSYKLVTADDKVITIEITNATKFWSLSKHLVVQI